MTDAAPTPVSDAGAEHHALQAAFPDWTLWRSDAGRWYATRRGPLAQRMIKFRLWVTVHAEDLPGLRAELEIQAARAEMPLAMFGTLS